MMDQTKTALVMLDMSSKVRDLTMRANGAIDLAFLRGASDSLQRATVALEDYVIPAQDAAKSFASVCFMIFPGQVVPPFLPFIPLAKGHIEVTDALYQRWLAGKSDQLREMIQEQGMAILRAQLKIKEQEANLLATTLTFVERAAINGLELARGVGRSLEKVGLKVLDVPITVAQEVGATARVGLEEVGETGRTVVETTGEVVTVGTQEVGKTVRKLTDEAADVVNKGLLIWAGVAVAAITAVGFIGYAFLKGGGVNTVMVRPA